LEHFKKHKCHPGGVPDMRRQCAKAADMVWYLQ
jgi:hypothetical protein